MNRTKFRTQQQEKRIIGRYQNQMYRQMASVMVTRQMMGTMLGRSFGGDRRIYTYCGYPQSITWQQYFGRFARQDIAKRINNAYPDATWRMIPEVLEDEEATDTTWEKEWKALLRAVRVFHYLKRVDRLCGIGEFAVLLLGFDDNKERKEPVETAKELLYMQPYGQSKVTIKTYVDDKQDKRFGLPDMYKIDTQQETPSGEGVSPTTRSRKEGKSELVHWSRVIHVAENTLENDYLGTPRQECVFNRLQDIETVLAGSAEMFWRLGFPFLSLEGDADTQLPTDGSIEAEMEDMFHGLSRYLKLQGIKANVLEGKTEDPSKLLDQEIKFISGATGIPQRILTGSERGELASSQDKENWDNRVDERRRDFGEYGLLRPFIDRLIMVGVLPDVGKEGYTVKWPDIETLTEDKQSEISKKVTEALASYVRWGINDLMPPDHFLTKVMGFPPEEVEQILKDALEEMQSDQEDDEELNKRVAEELKNRKAVAKEKKQLEEEEDDEDETD